MFYTDEQLSMIVSACQELLQIDRILMKKDVFEAEEITPSVKLLWKREDELCDWVNKVAGEVLFSYKAAPYTLVKQLERL